MLLPSLTNFISTLLSIFLPTDAFKHLVTRPHDTLDFRLRHFHAVTPSAHVYFADVPLHSSLHTVTQPLSIPISPVRTARPPSAAAFAEARALSMRGRGVSLDWRVDEIPGPDVSKRETLLLLAKMTSNAYIEPNTDGWYNLTDEWDIVRASSLLSSLLSQLICEPMRPSTRRLDGSRTTTASEGTFLRQTITAPSCSPSKARPHGGSTAGRRWIKISGTITCCSAAVAHTSTGRGKQCATATGAGGSVIRTASKKPLSRRACFTQWESYVTPPFVSRHLQWSSYRFWFAGVQNLYNNITFMFPDAKIWVIGHSLGGSLASLLGATFGVPVVTFEPPGERMAAQRLHLPSPVCTQSISMSTDKLEQPAFLSPPHITLLTYGTPRIRSRWVHATACCRPAHWEDMPWKAGMYFY